MPVSGQDLFEKAVRGDDDALRALLQRHGPQVHTVISGKIGRQWQTVLDADDVMQVTYLEAFMQIDQLMARDPASFTRWLTRIAENNLRDVIKVLERPKRPPPRKRVQALGGADSYVELLDLLASDSATPSRTAAKQEVVRMVDTALGELPGDYGTVIRLYDLEGGSAAQVAASMNRSVGAVHMLRSRAHVRLREMLGPPSKFFSD